MTPELMFEDAVQKQLTNDLNGAKLIYQKLLRKFPTNSVVLSNLGTIARRQGQHEAAEMLLNRALQSNPLNFSAMATLANLRIQQKRYDEAEEISKQALIINPQYAEALINLGTSYGKRNQIRDAEAAFRKVLSFAPNNHLAKINLANIFRAQKIHVEESIVQLETVLKQDPQNDEAWLALALAYVEDHQYVNALHAVTKARDISQKTELDGHRAAIMITLGEFEEAMRLYQGYLDYDPDNKDVAATLLFALNYDDRKTADEVFEEYKAYGQKLKTTKCFDHADHEPVSGRKIRVGYASADYYAHVVMFFMEPILRSHQRNDFEFFSYSNTTRSDNITDRVKKYFDHWIDVTNMNNEQMAEKIYNDKIDVLVDLSGHTSGTRLDTFAFRPAPVQCTYLGYGYTTGMNEIDYFIGDNNFTPPGCDPVFTESVYRIPAPVYAYDVPIGKTPDVSPLKALEKGYVTFGTMSRIIRLNNRMLEVWLQILKRVPGSKLRVDQKPFRDLATCERFVKRLETIGYHRDQLELVSTEPHWSGYHDFDIALDCWPHNAGTTTFEALWMGVPVISKRDRPSVGRLSAMVLEPLGLGDWIVDTEQEFVEKAVAMASDLDALAAIRATLRHRLIDSPFMDFRARAKGLEDAYVEMMRRFEAKSL